MKISMCRKMSLYVQHEMPNVPILFYFYWYLVSGIYYKTLKGIGHFIISPKMPLTYAVSQNCKWPSALLQRFS